MKKCDQLYKDASSEKDPDKKKSIFSKYKQYRNMIISLIRKSKRKFYINYFTEHNNNIKKTWEGIRQLVNINKKKCFSIKLINDNNSPITDNKEIANAFNNFYSNLGNSIEQKIPISQRNFSSFIGSPLNSSFYSTPCDEMEIKSIISNFGINKASGPNSIPTCLLKEFSPLLTYPIKLIINKSLSEGIFPNLLKTAQVCPIYKKSDKTKSVTLWL